MRFITVALNLIALMLGTAINCTAKYQYELPHIISVNASITNWGGGATHTMSMYNLFAKKGYPITLFIDKNSTAAYGLTQNHIPYEDIDTLEKTLKKLNHDKKKVVLLFNSKKDKSLIGQFLKKKTFRSILFQHNYIVQDTRFIENVDAIVCVNPDITSEYQKINRLEHLNIKKILHIPPFLSQGRFFKKLPDQSSSSYFKEFFDLTIKPLPIISVVANFCKDPYIKNHELLLKAISVLIKEKNRPVEVILAGDGPTRKDLENLASNLEIQDYVHFLGSVMNIAPVLYYSNFHILPSTKEAFGIAHVDAALMHKPSIGAQKTGAEMIINDGISGLLFKNSDLDDLVQKIEFLLDHEELQGKMGEEAYTHVKKTFVSNPHFKALEHLITHIFKKKRSSQA